MTDDTTKRRLKVGAEWSAAAQAVDFRVWAPRRERVYVVFEDGREGLRLERESGGYFRGQSKAAAVGSRYRFRLDGEDRLYPDPASRFQPDGPHGPSEIVDASTFPWTDTGWRGVPREGQVLYELHLGTFTREGTWAAAAEQLPELSRLGVTLVEVMPIADFPGRFGWGYDGVDWFAPSRLYGRPDDARRFIDRAHAEGVGVILDVVYNHFGPDGNYLPQFSDTYVTDRHKTDWGATINYDREGSQGVRDLVLANAWYWIEEFHFDGLRLDATQDIHDDSPSHILTEIEEAVRAAARGRKTYISAENEPQNAQLVRPKAEAGNALDALWNDDFHHTARVALTGRREAYYTDYGGTPQELISALKWGYLYQGQHYAWQAGRRGSSALDLTPSHFIAYLENHDQVANSMGGERLHHGFDAARRRALVTLMLLGPATPLLFQGEEFASSAPFLFFADHAAPLAQLVHAGRHEFLAQFPSLALASVAETLAPPEALATFERCKLDFTERATHAPTYALYQDLLALRRTDSVFRAPHARGVDGAVLTSEAFVLRFFGEQHGDDRLVLVNLGVDVTLSRAPEPFLAPPSSAPWVEIFSSEDVRYGGGGSPALERMGIWQLPAHSAVVLRPERTKP